MTGETITYSDYGNGGWTSRWSFLPDFMIGMNSSFYTWNNGSLYKHNTNETRNTFYDVAYPSTITTIFNQDALAVKMFKTISLDSTAPWEADMVTDMSNGFIDVSYFQNKEEMWYAYIRRDDDTIDTRAISTQGIGSVDSYSSLVLTFNFNIGTSLSDGDKVYKYTNGGSLLLVGEVASHDTTTITLVSEISAPTPGDMIAFVKNSQVESYGSRGYYMELLLTNNDTTEVEIFSVSSSVFKSNP